MRFIRTILFVLSAVVFTACGTAGNNFVRPSENLIQLDETTESEIVAAMGTPHSTSFYLNVA